MKFKDILPWLLAALFFIVIFQNAQVVTLKILFLRFSMSQIILMILFTLLGFVAGLWTAKKR